MTESQPPYQKPFFQRRIIRSIAVLLAVFLAYGAGFLTSQEYFPRTIVYTGIENQDKGKAEKVDFSLFWDTWKVVEDKYVNRQKLDYQALVFGSIEGLVRSLNDPYSVFFNTTTSKQFKESVQGTFSGIGAEIDIRDSVPTIIAPLKDSPAEKSGVLSGDQVLKVNDQSTEGLTLEEVVSKIRGPRGTTVKLSIRRKNNPDLIDISIRRATIKVPVIKYEMRDGVNYVQLYQFSETLPGEFSKAVEKILNSGSNRLIVDLRNNPGGFLEVAVDVASYFIPRDQTVVIEDFGNSKQNTFPSQGYELLGSYKVVVLANGGSASASEILAGALRDLKGIKLIGEKTFGKGSVQELVDLRQDTAVKITVANWLTPNKHLITGAGLEPDVKIELTEQDRKENKDPQLDKALELVKSL